MRTTTIVLLWLVSSVAVVGTVWWSEPDRNRRTPLGQFEERLYHYDAVHYLSIARDGYRYEPQRQSTVAFFPAFPLAAVAVSGCTGMPLVIAMALISNLAALAALFVFSSYLRVRAADDGQTPDGSDKRSARMRTLAIALLATAPTTLFFRVPYAESLTLLGCLLTLYGIEANKPLPYVAFVAGLTCAIRPVGIATLVPLLLYVWRISATRNVFAARLLYAIPLAVWGLGAYMFFQYLVFSEPLAFVKTQESWHVRSADAPWDKAISLLLLEPIWSVFTPSSPCYWSRDGYSVVQHLGLIVNPIVFAGAAGCVLLGARKRWLNGYETAFAAAMLLIPYVTKAYENCMFSHARFVAPVFPVYIVLGCLLNRTPRIVGTLVVAACAALLIAASYLHATGAAMF